MKTDIVTITVETLAKKYYKEWIFKNFNYTFRSGTSYAITGPNGSGKSTMLQILAGFLPQTEGVIKYNINDLYVSPEEAFRHLSLAAPYLELIEEYSLTELIDFHTKFKPLANNLDTNGLIEILSLEKSRNKQVKNFSSGMKQRLKLGLSLFSSSPIIFLDEPTSNLDVKGIQWYKDNVSKILNDKLVIICSNIEHEYNFCNEVINITDFQ